MFYYKISKQFTLLHLILEIKDNRRLNGPIAKITSGRIDVGGVAIGAYTVALVNVARHMHGGADARLQGVQQIDTAGTVSTLTLVSIANGRAVCHDNVRVRWDSLPDIA